MEGPVGGKIPHSHSSPATMDTGPQDPTTASAADNEAKKCGKLLSINVIMLDDSTATFEIQHKALGQVLFDQVCKQLHLLEVDYFGLEYIDSIGAKYWLDHEKPMNRQLGFSLVSPVLKFCVKFYTPAPAQLEEEYTRYLFCLQIKRDLADGILQCNDNTSALMASYIVQADCGDYAPEDYPDHTYLSSYKFVPHQDSEMERRIMENHKRHAGQSPAEADLNLLETARRCELYGIKMHSAKDHEGVPLNLATAHMGVLVFQNFTKINTFSWAKIRKLSFKRKRFLLKLHPEGYASSNCESGSLCQGYYKDTVEFFFEGRNECKNFWKKCVEHHGFFRCAAVKKMARQKTRVISRGSSFRYSGRTQKQIIDYVRENYVKRQPFQRSQSFRQTSTSHSGLSGVSSGKFTSSPHSVQPPIPIGTPTSRSCGSVTLSEGSSPSPTHADVSEPQMARSADTRSLGGAPVTNGNVHQDEDGDKSSAIVTNGEVDGREKQEEWPVTSTGSQLISYQQPLKVITEMKILESPRTATRRTISHSSSLNEELNSPPKSFCDAIVDTQPYKTTNNDIEAEVRRKRYPPDKAYFIAKEILMTERTYKKDLEVLNVWFRDEMKKTDGMPKQTLDSLFSNINPIYEQHSLFLRDIEQRLATWEGRANAHLKGDHQKIGDLILRHMSALELYHNYLGQHMNLLEELNKEYQNNKTFQQIYRDFEVQRVCYLPLTSLLLKPFHRLLHYRLLMDRLVKHHPLDHVDYGDCRSALSRLKIMTMKVEPILRKAENYIKLVELQRDLLGIDNLGQPGREFIREGCLQKFSKKGFQQRMFFLFSDVLIYTNRTQASGLQFRVHGQLPLQSMTVEDANDDYPAVPYSFNIYCCNKPLLIAASSQEEKDKWLEDLIHAIQSSKIRPDKQFIYSSLRTRSSSEELMDRDEDGGTGREEKTSHHRSNTTVHVCWHRNTSVCMKDQRLAIENQLSGFLLRKFKNSNGWQKLWVVFTNFCLFFYKSFQDDFPLASLPLLGYSVGVPTERDGITKEYVFKLQFKNHVYFFRAESEFTFGRWMEVISSATQHAGRNRLFSRKESDRDD